MKSPLIARGLFFNISILDYEIKKNKMLQLSKTFLFSTLICFAISCGSDDKQTPNVQLPTDTHCPGTVADATPTGNNDVLVWADEFDSERLPLQLETGLQKKEPEKGDGEMEKNNST